MIDLIQKILRNHSICWIVGQFKIAEILVKNKANVNAVHPKNMMTPLHSAAFGRTDNDFAIVELLIMAGANVNPINSKNETPLDIARDSRSDVNRLMHFPLFSMKSFFFILNSYEFIGDTWRPKKQNLMTNAIQNSWKASLLQNKLAFATNKVI